MSKYLGLIT